MRVLITGASGLLGRQLMQTFGDCEVIGTAFTRTGPDYHRLDLTKPRDVSRLIADFQPEVIVHAAAERRPDISEGDPQATEKLNVAATAHLAELAAASGAWLLYLSTDYVFDGSRPPYAIGATPNPLNNYGRSKLAGEIAVREGSPTAATLRVPILYGPVENLAESAITIILQAVLGGEATLDHWATRYPTHTVDVAAACRQLADRQLRAGDVDGVFHFAGDEPFTKYEIGRVFAEAAGVDASGLMPNPAAPEGAPRPRDCRLDCSRINDLLAPSRQPFVPAVTQVVTPFL